MKKNSTKKNEVCPDCGVAHGAADPKVSAQSDAISADVERIGEDIALRVKGEPAQAVALALMTLAMLALKQDVEVETNDLGERIGFTANLGFRFFDNAIGAVLRTERASTTQPTREQFPELHDKCMELARSTSKVEMIGAMRVGAEDQVRADFRDIPESAYRK